METIKTELGAGTAKRDRRGRKILSEPQWREIFASYERSELTQRKYCRREGINLHTFVGGRNEITALTPLLECNGFGPKRRIPPSAKSWTK